MHLQRALILLLCHTTRKLSSFSPPHLWMVMAPALLCGAQELILGAVVSLYHCPLISAPCVSGAQPSSAAEKEISFSPQLSLEISMAFLC